MSELKTQAWSTVNEALQLDANGEKSEAYKKYLEGVRKLCVYLEEESVHLFDKGNKFEAKWSGAKATSSSDSLGFETLNRNISGVNPSIASISAPVADNRSELSPIEKARRENGLIYRAYQARCQLVKDSKKRAELYLELHRKLTENIIVARAKEAALRQTQIQREKDILELAAKKLELKGGIPNQVTNNTQDWEKLLLYAQILQYEEKEAWPNNLRQKLCETSRDDILVSEVIKSTLSTSDHPLSLWVCKCQNQLLERIHFFLKDNDDFLRRYPLMEIPTGQNSILPLNSEEVSGDESVVGERQLLSGCNVSLAKMPLNKMWVEEDVLSLFDPLAGDKFVSKTPYSHFIDPEQERTALLRAKLNEIIKDTRQAIEMLVQMICATYELADDQAQDICYQMAENYLFRGIWNQLLRVFRVINYHSEKNMALVMERLSKSPPEEVGIPNYFDLESCREEAIAGLRRIATLSTPLAKLHQLVHVAQTVCSKKTHHASGKPFGADDLIGITCYLLVQTKMPHLVSEFEALEQLVPHRYLMGEEGYALTTHLTAMKYLESQLDVLPAVESNDGIDCHS